jgi:salicylate hydroxylase
LGTEIKETDCHAGTMIPVDATEVKKDLLVVADGIKSNYVNRITEGDASTRETGKSVLEPSFPQTS